MKRSSFILPLISISLLLIFPWLGDGLIRYFYHYREASKSGLDDVIVFGVSPLGLYFALVGIGILLLFFIVGFRHRKSIGRFVKSLSAVMMVITGLLYLTLFYVVFSPDRVLVGFSIAVLSGDTEKAERLMGVGADVNKIYSEDQLNPNGHSSLHIAIGNKDEKMVQMLMDNGANPLLKNSKGLTAVDIATSNNLEKILSILNKRDL